MHVAADRSLRASRSTVLLDELIAMLGLAEQPIVLLRSLTMQFDPTTDDIDLLLSAECRQQLLLKRDPRQVASGFKNPPLLLGRFERCEHCLFPVFLVGIPRVANVFEPRSRQRLRLRLPTLPFCGG